MAIDPYEFCPCGSGKKVKWCCPNLPPELEKINAFMENKQVQAALRHIDKLLDGPFNRAFLQTMKAGVIGGAQGFEKGFEQIEHVIEEFPDYAPAREFRADALNELGDVAEALDGYRDAQAHYPHDTTENHGRVLTKMGLAHYRQGRPIAAWACWQRALKLSPRAELPKTLMDENIKNNPLLPPKARRGLTLKSADEFAFFNEDRERHWENALAAEKDWQLEDVIAAFESLVELDKHDLAAWYNLGIVCAWAGENARAIEALDQYVQQESDFEAAVEAWDLGEVLRGGVGAEDFSDYLEYVALYEVRKKENLAKALTDCGNLVFFQPRPEEQIGLIMDWGAGKIITDPAPRPNLLAHFSLISAEHFEIFSPTEEDLRKGCEIIQEAAGESVKQAGTFIRPGDLAAVDRHAFFHIPEDVVRPKEGGPRLDAETFMESVRYHFEELWIHQPLRSLGDVSPIDAAQSEKLRPKLEAVVRVRERTFANYGVPYNFDRLRNKLNLEPMENLPPDAKVERDITGFSASELADTDPKSLSDLDLVAAYRTAVSLQADVIAVKFAEEALNRDAIAGLTEMSRLYRRIAQFYIEEQKHDEALRMLDKASEFDERNLSGRNRQLIDCLRAKVHLSRGDLDTGIGLYKETFQSAPERLDLLADAVEQMLSYGKKEQAAEFAKIGLASAEENRDADYQGRFREYLHDAEK